MATVCPSFATAPQVAVTTRVRQAMRALCEETVLARSAQTEESIGAGLSVCVWVCSAAGALWMGGWVGDGREKRFDPRKQQLGKLA